MSDFLQTAKRLVELICAEPLGAPAPRSAGVSVKPVIWRELCYGAGTQGFCACKIGWTELEFMFA